MSDHRTAVASDGFELPGSGVRHIDVALPSGGKLAVSAGRRGTGPRVLVVGGTHGDEFEGQVAAAELAGALDDLAFNGTLVVLPRHHEAACAAGTRASPVDGRDLNRVYGTSPIEGPTGEIASFVTDRVLPEVELVIDLHSGGTAHEFVPSGNLQATVGSAEFRDMVPMLLAFDAPYSIVFDEAGQNGMPHRGTLEGLARDLGKRALSSELGGGGRLTVASRDVARRGLSNVLSFCGTLNGAQSDGWQRSSTQLCALDDPDHYLVAPCSGLFVPERSLGDVVEQGAVLGSIVRDGAVPPLYVRSRRPGLVAALPAQAIVREGTPLAYVARPIDRPLLRS